MQNVRVIAICSRQQATDYMVADASGQRKTRVARGSNLSDFSL